MSRPASPCFAKMLPDAELCRARFGKEQIPTPVDRFGVPAQRDLVMAERLLDTTQEEGGLGGVQGRAPPYREQRLRLKSKSLR